MDAPAQHTIHEDLEALKSAIDQSAKFADPAAHVAASEQVWRAAVAEHHYQLAVRVAAVEERMTALELHVEAMFKPAEPVPAHGTAMPADPAPAA